MISGATEAIFKFLSPARGAIRRAGLIALAALLTGLPGSVAGQERPVLTFYYSIQQTEPAAADGEKLKAFIKERFPEGGAVLVQGFGCDTGGYERSLVIARQRGKKAAGLVAGAGIERKAILLSRPAVFYGEPRTRHRRARITVFKDPAAARAALRKADGRSRTTNARTKKKLDADEAAREEAEAARAAADAEQARAAESAARATAAEAQQTEPPAQGEKKWPWSYRLFLVLIGLIILLILFLLFERWEAMRKRASHQLSGEEAEALEVLTGGAVTPVAPAKPSPPAKKRAKIVSKLTRRLPMAKKKAKKQITPLNIQGAVDKEFEGRTLNQIRKAPIHALEGLTPRHATLLKEGFGIDTIEDLAKLKYFEIAKAITVLAKYEK